MKFIRHNGQWVPASQFARPPSVFPAIVRDQMDALTHMGNGKTYDSKSQFRRATKELGLVEIGNDNIQPRKSELPPVRESVAEAIQMLEQGYQPPPVETVDAADEGIRFYGS